MKVLVACEESQEVCKAFREKGHEAFSCDIQECSGGHPEWHILGDVLPLLDGNCDFVTQGMTAHYVGGAWDMIIAHPPCTYLTVTGNSWFMVEKYGQKAYERQRERYKAIAFFIRIASAKCEKIAVENPIGIMSSCYQKPDQIVHPYHFGDPQRKSTCLWLKGLPKLIPTDIVEPEVIQLKSGKTDDPWHFMSLRLPPSERQKLRSKTFPGIAKAMADQWGKEDTP